MQTVTTIGLDIAKSVFQVHGIDAQGKVVIRRQLRRRYVLAFFQKLPPCLVGIEACASSHHWSRELQALGHTVRLMPPAYVKPYVKRQKNDAADAEAICEAVSRPSMRFVETKTRSDRRRAQAAEGGGARRCSIEGAEITKEFGPDFAKALFQLEPAAWRGPIRSGYGWHLVFVDATLHGLGFASALMDLGLPQGDIPLALFAFNVGVEVGQLAFIAAVLGIVRLGRLVPIPPIAGYRLRTATSYVIGSVAAFWFIERLASF